MLGLGLGHDHALLGRLVGLDDGALGAGGAGNDLLVLLDQAAARAPVGDAAVAKVAALDAEAVSDFGSFHHGVAVKG